MKKDDIVNSTKDFVSDLKTACEVKDSFFNRYLVLFKRKRFLILFIISIIFTARYFLRPYSFLYVETHIKIFYTIVTYVVTILLYLLLLNIALSNILEKICLRMEDVRRIAMCEEKERLLPLFDNVYTKVKAKNKHISNKIKLYIVDTATVTAFSYTRSVVLSRGMIDTMNDDELKSIISHEFAHIANYDTHVNMLVKFALNSNLYFFYIINFLLKQFESLIEGENIILNLFCSIINFIRSIMMLFVNIILWFCTLLTCGFRRTQEYKADNFVYNLGYGESLISALKKIYDMQINDKVKLSQRIMREHPRTAYRIEKIEILEQIHNSKPNEA